MIRRDAGSGRRLGEMEGKGTRSLFQIPTCYTLLKVIYKTFVEKCQTEKITSLDYTL